METWAHNQVKNKIAVVVTPMVEEAIAGRFIADRMRLTHVDAGLSTEPDGMFVSFDSLRAGEVEIAEGANSLEVEGSPDMVLEVVSPSSEHKDTVVLRDLYWRAGVKEFWLADPRGDGVAFDILRRGTKGYAATRKQAGWVKSGVFGRSFRLTRQIDRAGLPAYTLGVRRA
jgi:Uma2 family endonuclease